MASTCPLVPGPRRPLVIAHRGASGTHPENTAAAFEAAARTGADAIETDVQLSADGVPFLLHDDTPDRTTDALARGWEPGTLAEQSTWADLRGLNASGGRGLAQRIPHLDEVAAAGLAVDLEIKTPLAHQARDVVAAIADSWRGNAVWQPLLESARVAVTSFDPTALLAAGELLAPWSVPLGLITEAAPSPDDLVDLTKGRPLGPRAAPRHRHPRPGGGRPRRVPDGVDLHRERRRRPRASARGRRGRVLHRLPLRWGRAQACRCP